MELPRTELESDLVGTALPIRAPGVWYGAPFIAAKYCGLVEPRWMNGEWQHGWHPVEHNIHPELVVGNNGKSRDRRGIDHFWVARRDQAAYLRLHGYKRVEAIGLPIVYLPQPEVERETGSLLVMPVHSLSYTKHSWDFDRYADEIAQIAGRFSRVVACVHPACYQKDYWVISFRNRGIPVISGAELTDRNSLLRMAVLLSRFEFMTTNGLGSHLVYAAYYGAKPSIFGNIASHAPTDFSEDIFYRNCPEILQATLEMLGEPHLRKTYPEFFCTPWAAKTCVEWGSWQVGVQCKRSQKELRRLFRWTVMNRAASRLKGLARKTPFWNSAKALRNRMFRWPMRSER
jgi:hypothetical protein